jgi:diaminopimelate decarboxylase
VLADEFGTPLVVYCEQTLRARARAYRRAAPEALVVYGTKAFPNVAVLRLFAEEGLGADVSTLGELEFALLARVPGERLVVHGNNKSDAELRRAAEAGAAFVVLDALDEVERAAAAGVRRVLVRITPGIEAETHEAIRTAHHGSKFGLPPRDALVAVDRARDLGLDVAGLHVHLGSQLLDLTPVRTAVDWLRGFVDEAAWEPEVIDVGGGLGVAYVEQQRAPSIGQFVSAILERLGDWRPGLILEPGRSLAAQAGVTLYRVGVVKDAGETTFVAIDGGMSDNPRPQLYDASYTAVLANRAAEGPARTFTVCGKHCEGGDILIRRIELPDPQRGDLLAVPVTGAYTLGMASNYNGVPRPAAVLVANGEARVIRRRETVDDLLANELS